MNTTVNNSEENLLKISLVNQGMRPSRRRKSCALEDTEDKDINYKNLPLLNKYITEGKGKIIPGRVSKICRKRQRKLAQAIKRARILGLLSFIEKIEE